MTLSNVNKTNKRASVTNAFHSMQTPRHRKTKRKLNKAVIQKKKQTKNWQQRKKKEWTNLRTDRVQKH